MSAGSETVSAISCIRGVAKIAPQAMDGDLDRSLGHAHRLCDVGVRLSRAVAGEKSLETVEQLALSRGRVLVAEPRQDTLEQDERPAAIEQLLGREIVARLEPVGPLGGLDIERDRRRRAAALQRPGAIALVREKVADRRRRERRESGLSPDRRRESSSSRARARRIPASGPRIPPHDSPAGG